ncbi:energy coupling factor transporter S component ThiW [Candidatus Bathyarchaeota archaeon]|nr:energy coupling factor transporter S component ThiW [Candidatus Bathyarchaeota archaeon]
MKIALSAVLTALGVILSPLFSIPMPPIKAYPIQHCINAISGVVLGPFWAVIVATMIGIIRNLLGTGTFFAFPGGIFGGLVVGLVYKYLWRNDLSALTESIGTVVIGATVGYAFISGLAPGEVSYVLGMPVRGVSSTMWGVSGGMWVLWLMFGASSIPGSFLGFLCLKALRRAGVLKTVSEKISTQNGRPNKPNFSYDELRGKKVLIQGDVGSGKTALTRRLLLEALTIEDPSDVAVIDMAPEVAVRNGVIIGGKLLNTPDERIRVLNVNSYTPRLTAKSPEELLELADTNRKRVEELFEAFDEKPSRILFVNDVSIYLQRGDLEKLLGIIDKAETVIANGYYGEGLKEDLGTGVSAREKSLMEELARRMEVVIKL